MEQLIKDVAIYIRKSRNTGIEEDEETLKRHKDELVMFAQKQNFRYVLYEEVKSGDRIIDRPKMIQLLKDIEEELFDAVLVIDIDRLGRGDEEDSGKIKRIFRNSNTFIITPSKIYNLENEDDETYLEFQTFLARQEYKMIKKRLFRGKKIGSRMGNWTNGIPPIPYNYDSKIKGLVIDDEKNEIYQKIKSMFINQMLTPQQIAWNLNSIPILSPKGKDWSGTVIQRILIDETHLGKIISNKTKGNLRKGQKVINIPKDKWIVVENCHVPVKTQEEHNIILSILSKRKKSTKRGVRPKCVLSGIIRCGYCNSILQVHSNSKYDYNILVCPGYNNVGKKCKCKGIRENILTEHILSYLDDYIDMNNEESNESKENDLKIFNKKIIDKQKMIDKIQKKLANIFQMFEDGDYTKEEFHERKKLRQQEIDKINIDISSIQKQLDNLQNNNSYNGINKDEYKLFKQEWKKNIGSELKNQLLHSIIKEVQYKREKENLEHVYIDIIF